MASNPAGRVRRLDINFAERRLLGTWVQWAILAAGVLTVAAQAQSYVLTRQRVAEAETRAARISTPARTEPVKARDPKEIEAQIAGIERVVNRLTFEWHVLFRELERATTHDIALSSIEPEPDTRSLVVSGVAKDYLALLNYVANLRSSGVLSNVFLKKHEVARNQPQQGVSFTWAANWREPEHHANAHPAPAN